MQTANRSATHVTRSPGGREASPRRDPRKITRVPLSMRFDRLNEGLPSDDFYGQCLVRDVRQLLNTSLKQLCGPEADAGAGLLALLSEPSPPGRAFVPGKVTATYGDALRAAHSLRMKSGVVSNDPDNDTVRKNWRLNRAHTILVKLGQALLTPPREAPPIPAGKTASLEERFRAIPPQKRGDVTALLQRAYNSQYNAIMEDNTRSQEYPALVLPLSHYFYAMGAIRDPGDPLSPLRLAQKITFHGFLDPDRVMFNLAFMVKLGIGQGPGGKPFDGEANFSFLYDLLVRPLFPQLPKNEPEPDALPF